MTDDPKYWVRWWYEGGQGMYRAVVVAGPEGHMGLEARAKSAAGIRQAIRRKIRAQRAADGMSAGFRLDMPAR